MRCYFVAAMLAGNSRRRIRSTYLPIFLVWQMPRWPRAVVCHGECPLLAMPESFVVVLILMNGEQPFGIGAAAAVPIAFFIFGRDKPSCFIGEVLGVNLRLNKPIIV
jgi:hypothetical protein